MAFFGVTASLGPVSSLIIPKASQIHYIYPKTHCQAQSHLAYLLHYLVEVYRFVFKSYVYDPFSVNFYGKCR